jgi:predicted RNA binding protein YcfA (HicA-like mRNA interferase family)
VTFEELRSLLEGFGFELRRVKGSHHIFIGEVAGRKRRPVIPFRRPHVKQGYVEDALKLIEQLVEETGEDDKD